MPGTLLLAWVTEHFPNRLRQGLRLIGESSLEIYLINVIITREFDILAPCLDIGPRHIVYYTVVYTLNLLAGLGLHRLLNRKRRAVPVGMPR